MRHGHVTGTRVETQGSQDWYTAIAEQHIARLEAAQTAQDDAERALTTALAHQVGNAVAAMPEAAARIARAATLVQTRQVWPMTDGTWLVGSQSDTDRAYLVRRGPWTCDCADHTQRAVTCKHAIAAMLTVKLGAQYRAQYN